MEENYNQKKETIRKAAVKIFASYGFSKTTLDDIANSVGIKKNSLYYYFESKEQLFNEIITEELKSIIGRYEEAFRNLNTCEEKVLEFCRISDTSYCEIARLYSVKANAFLEFGIILEKSGHGFVEKTRKILKSILKEGIKKGEFLKHDVDELAEVILDIIFVMEFIQIAKYEIEFFNEIKQQKQDEITNYMLKAVKYILQGIKNKK